MALNLDVSRTEDIAVVRCRGRIVFGEEADELRRVVLSLLNETRRIVVNLAWIEHIDSSGLETLVASFISARHRRAEIKFAALSPRSIGKSKIHSRLLNKNNWPSTPSRARVSMAINCNGGVSCLQKTRKSGITR